MATTTGFVEQVTPAGGVLAAGAIAQVRIQPPGGPSEDFTISTTEADGAAALAAKQALVALLLQIQQAGWPVTVTHQAAEVEAVALGGFDIKPVGHPITDDFFTVTGSSIPVGAKLVFESGGGGIVHFTPDLVRPEWVFVARFPGPIVPGRYSMWLATSSWSTDAVPVDVAASAAKTVRVLNPGAPTAAPYTVTFVANPAYIPLPAPRTGSQVDPAIISRKPFHGAIRFCLETLLEVAEDLIRGFDPDIRFVAVFDTVEPSDATALLEEDETDSVTLRPRRGTIQNFLTARGLQTDVVFVLAGSPTYKRAYAVPTKDDSTSGGPSFAYDSFPGVHGLVPSIPGMIALPMGILRGPIALHEFCHAAAETENGLVIDLYVDGDLPDFPLGPRINKKWLKPGEETIPDDFATYEGTTYQADKIRDSLNYEPGWTSYHAVPTDGTRPNLMDIFGLTADPMACRLDQLTRQWLFDRIQAKLSR